LNPIRDGDHRSTGRRHHHPRGRRGAAFTGDGEPIRGSRRHRGRGRAPRGDVRTAVLLLIAEQPMHGYQLMQAIAERSGGAWTPSPGAVYPTINQLEDEGLVRVTADAGRKLVTLTDVGRHQLAEHRQAWGDPFAGFDPAAPGADLQRLVREMGEATRQVGRAGTDTQRAAAAKILTDARRALYLLLADGAEADA
jgi:DNA-binding PadR family transcriptional regulator